jgi:hypothetical protein
MGTGSGFLSLISAAVTPVVMVSACAALIIGIGSKHAGLADQARSLASQYRADPMDATRRLILQRQLRLFLLRATLAWLAHCLLYLSAAIFAATVLVALFALRRNGMGQPTIILFTVGTAALVPALALELTELLLAQRTLIWDTEDVLSESKGAGPGSGTQ